MIKSIKHHKKLTKYGIIVDAIALVGLIISFLGGHLNYLALSYNGGRMPVLLPEGIYASDTNIHFHYTDPDEVNVSFLTDIITIRNGEGITIYSIGDILMDLGFMIALTSAIIGIPFLIIKRFQFSRKERQLQKIYKDRNNDK